MGEKKKRGFYESDEAVFRLRCAGSAFCLGFAFSMLCLSACIRSIICARSSHPTWGDAFQ